MQTRSECVLALCAKIGAQLNSFQISLSSVHFGASFSSIASLCPNILSIITTDDLPCTLADISFDAFLSLRELRLSSRVKITSALLDSVPASIEILTGVRGDFGFFEKSEQLADFFRAHSRLKEVELQGLLSRDRSLVRIFDTIALCCPMLKRIHLRLCPIALEGIELLSDLKVIKIQSTSGSLRLSDEQVRAVCERSPRLEVMDFAMHHERCVVDAM